MKKILLTFIWVFLLSSCTTPVVGSHKSGIHTIKYTYGMIRSPGNVVARMQDKADNLCQKNWRKLDERHLNEGDWGAEEWDIKCM